LAGIQIDQRISPSPLLSRHWCGAQIVFKQIDSHAFHVLLDVVFPVEGGQIKEEKLLVLGVEIPPEILDVVVGEFPFVSAEERDDVCKLMNFLVSFQQSKITRRRKGHLDKRHTLLLAATILN
jgi:hypothetical protein